MTQPKCAICGAKERPERGWIYRSTDLKPADIVDGEMKWEATEDATAFCSTSCLDEHKQSQEA